MHRAMANRVEALSMSWRVGRAVREEGWDGEILAVFPHSCYVVDENGAIYALVEERAGNGPLNLVIPPAGPNAFSHLGVGDSVRSNGEVLLLSDSLDVGLAGARLWDPKPYPALGTDPDQFRRALGILFGAASIHSPQTSLARLLPYLQDEDLPDPLARVGHFPRSHALMGGLVESLAKRNRRGLKVVASSMAGLGPGLTPACDDYLAGVLLALAVRQHQQADAELAEIAHMLVETAAPRTGEISAAYLKAAHAGEAHERWHHLLSAVAAGDAATIEETAKLVMQVGETSGADMLAGFLAAMRIL